MKKTVIALLLVLVLLAVGCPSVAPPIEPPAMSLVPPGELNPTWWTGPARTTLTNMEAGKTANTFTADLEGYISSVSLKAGDPICVLINNPNDCPTEFTLVFVYRQGDSDKGIAATPEGVKEWVIIGAPFDADTTIDGSAVIISSASPLIPPTTVAAIPISIGIPKGTELPDRWDFGIAVQMGGQGMVQVAHEVQFRFE